MNWYRMTTEGLALVIVFILLLLVAYGFVTTPATTPVQPERYHACLIVKQDELFCLSYERENVK